MKRTIFLFIAILALAEFGVAFLYENNSDVSGLIVSEDAQTNTAKNEAKIGADPTVTPNPDDDIAVQEITPLDKYFKYNVCVDVSCITSDAREKEVSQDFARNIVLFLQQSGFSVGTTNADLPDNDRALKASKYDIVISITSDGGYEYYGDAELDSAIKVYTSPDSPNRAQSDSLAGVIANSITFNPNGHFKDRIIIGGVQTDAYNFLKLCNAPTILISTGWYNGEYELLNDKNYVKTLSAYIARGIRNYADANPKPESNGKHEQEKQTK